MTRPVKIILLLSIVLFLISSVFVFHSSEFRSIFADDPQKKSLTKSFQVSNNNSEEKEDTGNSSFKGSLKEMVEEGMRGVQPLQGQKKGRTNFLILGTPGKPHPAPTLTDSIMVVSIFFPDPKVRIVSIPRDLAVHLPGTGGVGKINSVYTRNLSRNKNLAVTRIKDKVEQISGLDIHYYVKLDLNVVKKVVAELGGINIKVPENISDPRFPGSNYSYQNFEVKEGWRFLSPEQAAKFVRSRNTAAGDLDRIKRQKALLAAITLKLENMDAIDKFSTLYSLWKSVKPEINSNLKLQDLRSLYSLRQQVSIEAIEVAQLDIRGKDSLLTSDHIQIGSSRAFVLVPKAGLGNYKDIHHFFKNKIK